ncbi:MAG: metallophosphoesterase, partial [Myxococcales bacterium]|nr:metallophosphoesterase [Myxococcales bacterium]
SAPLAQEIKRAIASISARGELPDRDRVTEVLRRALDHLGKADELQQSSALLGSEEYELSLVRSAIRSPQVGPARVSLTGREVVGFAQYAELDVRWVATLWNHLFRSVVPFPVAPSASVRHPLQRTCTIALAGDWGTGNDSSRNIANEIAKLSPTYTVHLGDVYYSGTDAEEMDHLLRIWPRGLVASFTLNSNHEMYSGGHGYFGTALTSETFETQGGYSYFCLSNDDWVLLGLDTAHAATKFYQLGALNQPQLDWIADLEASGLFIGPAGARKKVIVLSHHQGLAVEGKPLDPLWTQVTTALRSPPDYWYWGHDHGVVVFRPQSVRGGTVRGRLVGHGGVPYLPDAPKDQMLWTESETANDLAVPRRALNGFALLHLEAGSLIEEMWDEHGRRRWTSQT